MNNGNQDDPDLPNYILSGEEYTSQRCLNCSGLTKTASEIYVCKNCKFKIDRDILGSTNILIKKCEIQPT